MQGDCYFLGHCILPTSPPLLQVFLSFKPLPYALPLRKTLIPVHIRVFILTLFVNRLYLFLEIELDFVDIKCIGFAKNVGKIACVGNVYVCMYVGMSTSVSSSNYS